jgi:hypothetical protein
MKMKNPNNRPIAFALRDDMLWVTLKDNRVVGAPVHWFPWLADAPPEQQGNFELSAFSIYWPDLDDGVDVDALLTGNWTPPMDEEKLEPENA